MKLRRAARRSLILAVPLLVLVLASLLWILWRPTSINRWIAEIRRPGWRLLHASESDSHYFAIFRVGTQLAVCEQDRSGRDPTMVSVDYSVRAPDGRYVADFLGGLTHDTNHYRLRPTLRHPFAYEISTSRYPDGLLFDIEPDYAGPLHCVLTESEQRIVTMSDGTVGKFPDPEQTILDITVPWDRPAEN